MRYGLAVLLFCGLATGARAADRPREAALDIRLADGRVFWVRANIRESSLTVTAGTRFDWISFGKRVPLPQQAGWSVSIAEIRVPGVATPLALVAADGPAADGATVSAVLLGFRGEVITQVADLSRIDGLDDGLCVDDRVIVAESITGTEAVVAPHRYKLIVYRWQDGGFAVERKVTTRRRHSSAEEAAAEFGLRCTNRLAATVLGNGKSAGKGW